MGLYSSLSAISLITAPSIQMSLGTSLVLWLVTDGFLGMGLIRSRAQRKNSLTKILNSLKFFE